MKQVIKKNKFSNFSKRLICAIFAIALVVGLSPDAGYAVQVLNANKSWDVNAQETSTAISDEGITLLKNDNISQDTKSLPLSDSRINIFGGGGCDKGWYYQGNGSGSGSHAYRVPLYQAFREVGFDVNETLAKAYNESGFSNECPVTEDPAINFIIHQTTTKFVEDKIEQARKFSNQAVFVISRYGGEGNELPKFQAIDTLVGKDGSTPKWERKWDPKRIYSQLTAEEEEQLKLVCKEFDNVCVLFNCCNPMQMGFLNDSDNFPNLKSALYMPMGGSWGTYSVPNILSGQINPSGHLGDTIAYDFKTAPSFANTSYNYTDDGQSFARRYEDKRFADHKNDYIHYTAYEENIYIGYYWYETAEAEHFWEKQQTSYDKVVQYPFGYGLSYTNFEWSNVKYTTPSGDAISSPDDNDLIKVSVDVTNTGSVAGKDVVELYVLKPYYSGGIEKPAVQLVTFAKTDLIEPGHKQTVYMQFNMQDIADYDCYDKNNNGHMGYELDKGQYTLSLRTNCHTPKNSNLDKNINVTSTINYDKDKETKTKVQNLFTTYTNPKSHATSTNTDKHPVDGRCGSIDGSDFNAGTGIGATYLTRENFKSTFPKQYLASPNLGDDYLKTWKVNKPWLEDIKTLPKQGQKVEKTLDDVKGKSYEDPLWDKVMDSLTYEEMFALCQAKGGFGSPAIPKIKKPETVDKDGPCGFGSGARGSRIAAANYPSDSMIGCTWNYKLAQKFGNAIGYEAVNKLGGIDGNYGPGLNIHRSPLGGRNFEYYSEDPILSGTLCSFQISAALDQGLYCYVKHIALNDCDCGRNGKYNFATEQTFRQIYAKAFEIICKGATICDNNNGGAAIKAHKANALMASVDRVGTTRVTGSYNFLTQMLRNEWGFRGSVVTDYYQSGDVNDVDEGIRSGNDLMLNGANNCEYDDVTSNTSKFYVRQAAKNILYTYINTQYYKQQGN